MGSESDILDVVMVFRRMVNHWKAFERMGHEVGGEHFTSGEMQTLRVVAECPARNTTELAEQLGVTKGAISQSVTKLAERGLLERYRSDQDDRSTYTRLTRRGSSIYQAHMKRYAAELSSFARRLDGAAVGEVRFMVNFVDGVSEFFREQVRLSGD